MKPEAERSGDYALAVFAFFWACAELFHRVCFARFAGRVEWLSVPILIFALAAILRPRRLEALAALCAFSALHTFVKVPVSNHMTFGGVANLAVFLVLVRHRLKNRPEIWEELAAALRAFVLILYFFAVLHKLNADYVGAPTSCGAHFWDVLSERLPFLPEGPAARRFGIYASLVMETAIPVFLLIPRLRRLGILSGFAFHALLLAADNGSYCLYSFSSLVIASYVVFIDPFCWNRAKSRLYRLEQLCSKCVPGFRSLKNSAAAVFASLALFCIASFLAFLSAGSRNRPYEDSFSRFGLAVWILYAFCVIIFFLSALAGRPSPEGRFPPAFAPRPWPKRIGTAILLFYGLSPYVGLRTMPCFSMFSNLRTEGAWNHLFMPRALKIFPYQEDLVEVLRSTDPDLQKLADRKALVPYWEFESLLTQAPRPVSVEYIRLGERHVVADPPKRADNPLTYWFRTKFIRFRGVSKEGPMACVH